jgi:hypothetical protein
MPISKKYPVGNFSGVRPFTGQGTPLAEVLAEEFAYSLPLSPAGVPR